MDDRRIPKQVFYGQLANGKRARGGQYRRYKDTLKANLKNLKTCGIPPDDLEYLASDRIIWRAKCRMAVEEFELNQIGDNGASWVFHPPLVISSATSVVEPGVPELDFLLTGGRTHDDEIRRVDVSVHKSNRHHHRRCRHHHRRRSHCRRRRRHRHHHRRRRRRRLRRRRRHHHHHYSDNTGTDPALA